MNKTNEAILNKHEDEITHEILEIKQSILDNKRCIDSFDFYFFLYISPEILNSDVCRLKRKLLYQILPQVRLTKFIYLSNSLAFSHRYLLHN